MSESGERPLGPLTPARPSVSVCIPTYNCGHLIGAAIRSVLGQEDPGLELLVVDNASTDHTEEIVAQMRDARIRYVRHPANLGFARNLQRALELSTGTFLQFLCADDYLYPAYLQRTTAWLASHPEAVLVHTGHDLVDAEGTVVERRSYPWPELLSGREFATQLVAHQMAGICLSSALLRREPLLRAGGIDPALELSADYGMWLALSVQGAVGYLPEPLVAYRVHTGQATNLFVPGRTLRLVETFLAAFRARGWPSQALEAAVLRPAVAAAARELPRARIEGASLAAVLRAAARLVAAHHRPVEVLRTGTYAAVALLPHSWLRRVRRLHHTRRRAR